METGNIGKFSISSIQYLLYRISFEEGIVTRRKNDYKNHYPRWVIKQILTQMEKQQERNNVSNNNIDDSHTNNENSFLNENINQRSVKQLSFITLPYKGQQGEKVIK